MLTWNLNELAFVCYSIQTKFPTNFSYYTKNLFRYKKRVSAQIAVKRNYEIHFCVFTSLSISIELTGNVQIMFRFCFKLRLSTYFNMFDSFFMCVKWQQKYEIKRRISTQITKFWKESSALWKCKWDTI